MKRKRSVDTETDSVSNSISSEDASHADSGLSSGDSQSATNSDDVQPAKKAKPSPGPGKADTKAQFSNLKANKDRNFQYFFIHP